MPFITRRYLPNVKRCQFATNSTAWNLIATDGVGYADYPTLKAAGKSPFPGEPAEFPNGVEEVLIRSYTAETDGGEIFVDINRTTVPSDTSCYDMISGGGQTLIDSTVKLVWIRKTTGTDVAIISGRY